MNLWQPIETAPKDGTGILGVDMDCKTPTPSMIHWGYVRDVGETWRLYDEMLWDDIDTTYHGNIGWMNTPTHWMRLPSPPEEYQNESN
jgi:hypothetical protein